MTRLLKADFKRFFKDKLFLVSCIIALVFSIINPLLYKLIFSNLLDFEMEELGMIFDLNTLYFQSFSLSNNLGLIVPILIIIIIFKDFSFGTIRNKIIAGHNRTNIFLSLFIVSSAIISIIMFSSATITGLLSMALFPDLVSNLTSKEIGYFIASIGFELLVMIFVAALVSFLSVFMKNAGLAIIIYAALMLAGTALNGVASIAINFLSFEQGKEEIVKLIENISYFNIFANNSSVIGLTASYNNTQVLLLLLSSLLGISIFVGLGILVIKKKDIK